MEYPLNSLPSIRITPTQDSYMIVSDSSFSPHSFVNRQTILLVEDQPELRWMLKHLLESKERLQVGLPGSRTNGVEALSVIDHHPSIGLILSDYRMPRMDGLLLLQVPTATPNQTDNPVQFLELTAELLRVTPGSSFGVRKKEMHMVFINPCQTTHDVGTS